MNNKNFTLSEVIILAPKEKRNDLSYMSAHLYSYGYILGLQRSHIKEVVQVKINVLGKSEEFAKQSICSQFVRPTLTYLHTQNELCAIMCNHYLELYYNTIHFTFLDN